MNEPAPRIPGLEYKEKDYTEEELKNINSIYAKRERKTVTYVYIGEKTFVLNNADTEDAVKMAIVRRLKN